MNTLIIVYSNLGLGGIPTRIVDIVNKMVAQRPETTVYLLLKERHKFNLERLVVNRSAHVMHCPIDHPVFFIFWMW